MSHQGARILVVGGGGFIGRHVIDQAVSQRWEVTSLSLRPIREARVPHVHHLFGDITNRTRLAEVLGKAAYEYVVNCGGYIDHTPLRDGGRSVMNSHFVGVLNLIEILDRETLLSFVNLGSSDEYGDAPAPQTETQREAPISPYSLGKVAAAHLLQMLHRTESYPSTTLRLFLTYGPGQDDERFLPQIIRGCLEDRAFATSSGEQLRDFCFIDDTVRAIFAALDCPEAGGEVINIGSGVPVSIREVIEAVRAQVGMGVPEFGELPYRVGENMELYPDTAKAGALLRWQPEISLSTGIDRTIRWLRAISAGGRPDSPTHR